MSLTNEVYVGISELNFPTKLIRLPKATLTIVMCCCVKIQNDCSKSFETRLLAYADDIDIVGRSQLAVRDAYLALEREAAKEGLKINEQKTKYMIAARNDRTIRDVGKAWQLVTKTLKSSKNLCT
jgi:hypothetical protein